MCRGIDERIDNLQLLDNRPGPSVRDDERQRIFMFRTNVNEMNVQPIDLGDELRQGIQIRPALAPIVFCPPVALARYWGTEYDWCKCEAKLNALPQFGKLRFRKIRLKRANRILVCLFAGSLCSSAFGHGVPLSSRFGLLQRWTWRSLFSHPWKDQLHR